MVFTKRAFVIINPIHPLHNDIMYTSHSVSLTQSTSRTLTIQCWIKFISLRGHHGTPCDAYTKSFESRYAAGLAMYVETTFKQPYFCFHGDYGTEFFLVSFRHKEKDQTSSKRRLFNESFFFFRSLTHLTYLAVLLTSSRVTEITWPNTWRSTKMCKPCGTLAPRRGANLWSGPPQWTLNAPLWTTVRVETGLTTRRDMGKSFCFIQLSARTFGFQWETSLQINAEGTNQGPWLAVRLLLREGG